MEENLARTTRLLAEGKLPIHCCSYKPKNNGLTLQQIAQRFPTAYKQATKRMWIILSTTAVVGFLSGLMLPFILNPPKAQSFLEKVMFGSMLGLTLAMLLVIFAFLIGNSFTLGRGTPVSDYQDALWFARDSFNRMLKEVDITADEFERMDFAETFRCASAALSARALAIVRLEKDPETHTTQAKFDQVSLRRAEFTAAYDNLAYLGFAEGGYGGYFATAEATYAEEHN